jgi:indole-3-glycerol phosphate synthase
MTQAAQLGLAPFVEVHTEAELEAVLPLAPAVVGVNNRNLQTFEVDFANTGRLRRRIPTGTLVVAESGIQGPEDVRRLGDLGVDAILVGESLMRSKDVLEATRRLVRAGRR